MDRQKANVQALPKSSVKPSPPASGPKENSRAVTGVNTSRLREVPALAGVRRRNYDYVRFWVVFPLKDASGEPLMSFDGDVELVVRIYDKEGRVRWHVPDSIRQRLASRTPAPK